MREATVSCTSRGKASGPPTPGSSQTSSSRKSPGELVDPAGALRPKYPAIAQSWRRNWEQVIPFFAFAPDLRKILYTTNAIESLNAQVRKAVRVRGHFPTNMQLTQA